MTQIKKERKLDLWPRIAAEISSGAQSSQTPDLTFSQRLRSYFGIGAERPAAGVLFGLPQASAAFAALLLVFVYFGQGEKLITQASPEITRKTNALESSIIAGRELKKRQLEQIQIAKRKSRALSEGQLIDTVPRLSAAKEMLSTSIKGQNPPAVRMASNRAKNSSRELRLSPRRNYSDSSRIPAPFERSVELILDDDQWIGTEDRIPGGLRAGGVDIDWIKTDRPFKILTPSGQDSPVIWIGRSRFDNHK